MKPLPVILFVDDVEISIKLVELLITRRLELDCYFFYATNGKEAVDFCKSNQVDLIFMNLLMPVMDGFEATKIIKKMYPKLPIVAHTAYQFELIEERYKEANFDAFIKIPLSEQKIRCVIEKFVMA